MDSIFFVIFIAVFATVFGFFGYLGYKKTRTTEDYFIAGRSMGGFIIALSYDTVTQSIPYINLVYNRLTLFVRETSMDRYKRVSEVARELCVSERWLRVGEKKGKLPIARRDMNGWRVYTKEDIKKLKELLIPRKS